MNQIHINSFKSVQIELLAQETKAHLGYATGFICLYSEKYFLVTNWHVVSGRHFQKKDTLHPSGATPGSFNLSFHLGLVVTENSFSPTQCSVNNILLYDCFFEENAVVFGNSPLWIEHPQHSSDIDVVVLDVTQEILQDEKYKTLAYHIQKEHKTELGIMDEVFVVGYPIKSTTTPNSYPIYKGATIASEPNVTFKLPIFYIDGKTKKGMSGSPVIKKHKPQLSFDHLLGNLSLTQDKTELIGVYSGRDTQSKDEYEAELGIVWKIQECLIPILEEAVKINVPETTLAGQLRSLVKANNPPKISSE